MSSKIEDKQVYTLLLKSAQLQFQKYGLSKTTMNDIAKQAGKGKSTLYHYFTSKQDVFVKVIIMEIDDLFEQLNKAVELHDTCKDQYKAFIVTKLKVLKEKKNLYQLVFEKPEEQPFFNSCKKELDVNYREKEKTLIKKIIIAGSETGELNFDLTKVDLFSELLSSCGRGIEYDILINNKYKFLEEESDFLISIFMKSLS